MPFSELIGQPCYEVLHGLPHAPPDCPHERLLATGAAQRNDFEESRLGKDLRRNQHASAKHKWNVQRLHSCTARRERSKTGPSKPLRNSEEQLRLILTSTAEAIYGLDGEGNCTFCNPACLRFLGYRDPQDLLGKNMHLLVHHTRADGTTSVFGGMPIDIARREGKSTHVVDEALWRRDGTSFPAEYWSYPIEKNGRQVGSVVTFLDISERKTRGTNASGFGGEAP